MREAFPSPEPEPSYKAYELLRDTAPGEIIEVLGDYSVVVNNNPDAEPWIGVTSLTHIDRERIENQNFPDFIWKLHETGHPTFYQQQPDGRNYVGRKPANNVDALLTHLCNIVEHKHYGRDGENPKRRNRDTELIAKLIDRSTRKKPRRPDRW